MPNQSESAAAIYVTRRAETIRETTGCSWERACDLAARESAALIDKQRAAMNAAAEPQDF